MSSKATGPVLITGGTGQLGSRVAALMRSESVPHLVASRSVTGPQGVKFDYNDRETWDAPFDRAAPLAIPAVFLLGLATTVPVEVMNEFVDFALEKGVRRFVLLSASIVEMGGPVYGKVHSYLKGLGDRGLVEWAVLRPTWFMDNFAEQPHHAKSIKDEGKIYSATGDGRLPWVSADDIAACAVQTLTVERPPNTDYFILGPELLTYDDVAGILTEVLGKTIVHQRLTSFELEEMHMANGIPENYAKVLASLDIAIKNGAEDRTGDVVLALTGKEPGTFRAFAEASKAAWE